MSRGRRLIRANHFCVGRKTTNPTGSTDTERVGRERILGTHSIDRQCASKNQKYHRKLLYYMSLGFLDHVYYYYLCLVHAPSSDVGANSSNPSAKHSQLTLVTRD